MDLASDISSIGNDRTEAEEYQEEIDDLESEISELETELEHERQINSLNEYMSEWEYKALRKTTLPKGFSLFLC